MAMIAGNDPAGAFRICRNWRKRILASDKEWSFDVLVDCIRAGMDEYIASPLSGDSAELDFIVTGFCGDDLILLHAFIYSKQPRLVEYPFSTAIGSGAHAALAMLNHRQYTASVKRERAIYAIYEAKKFSEHADGVGANTQIMIHGPFSGGDKDTTCGIYLSDAALQHLEGLRQGLFIPPKIPGIEKFPDDYFQGDYPFSN